MCAALYEITFKALWQLDVIFLICFYWNERKKRGNVNFACQLSLPTCSYFVIPPVPAVCVPQGAALLGCWRTGPGALVGCPNS